MKTAEENVIDFMRLCGSDEDSFEGLKKTPQFRQAVEFWKAIQLDAYRSGMTDAAEIVGETAVFGRVDSAQAFKNILAARDKKNQLT